MKRAKARQGPMDMEETALVLSAEEERYRLRMLDFVKPNCDDVDRALRGHPNAVTVLIKVLTSLDAALPAFFSTPDTCNLEHTRSIIRHLSLLPHPLNRAAIKVALTHGVTPHSWYST